MHQFLKLIFGIKLYMFRTVPSSIIRGFSLYNSNTYRLCDSRIRTEPVRSWFCSQAASKPVWHMPLLCVQWKTPDDGQRNCPKHVNLYSKNKFEKSVLLVGFIVSCLSKVEGTWTESCIILTHTQKTHTNTLTHKHSLTHSITDDVLWNSLSVPTG